MFERIAAVTLIGLGSVLVFGACHERTKSPKNFHLPAGDAVKGKEAFVEFECNGCHWVNDDSIPAPTVSPPVPVFLGGETPYPPNDGKLVTAILDPSHDLGPGFKRGLTTKDGKSRMPDYRRVMTLQEMTDIVAYLHERFKKVTFTDRATKPHPK